MSRPTPIVVLVGGLSMRATDYAELAGALTTRGIEHLTFDNLCVGDGPRVDTPSIESQAEHAWREIDRRLPDRRPIVLFGLSMGGMIVATMATLAPSRIRHLVLAATSANTAELPAVPDTTYQLLVKVQESDELNDFFALAFGKTTHHERPEVVRKYLRYRLDRKNNQSLDEFLAQIRAIRAFSGSKVYHKLKDLPVPTTLMSGEEDRLFPTPHSHYLARFARNHLMFAKVGHMLHLEDTQGLADHLAAIARESEQRA